MTRLRRLAMPAAAAAFLAMQAGCGSDPSDPGDPAALQVLGLAAHARTLDVRIAAVGIAYLREGMGSREARLQLEQLDAQARLLEEDVSSRVPFGAPARVPALDAAREVRKGGAFLHSYVAGHAGGLLLARAHLARAGRSLAGAGRVLAPRLGPPQQERLALLRRPPPPP